MKNVERAGVALGAFASVLLTPTLAFAEGTESGGADILIPKMAEFVPALLIFLIIWFLLAKFVWPKVISVLDAREHKIEDSIEEADATKLRRRDSRRGGALSPRRAARRPRSSLRPAVTQRRSALASSPPLTRRPRTSSPRRTIALMTR